MFAAYGCKEEAPTLERDGELVVLRWKLHAPGVERGCACRRCGYHPLGTYQNKMWG